MVLFTLSGLGKGSVYIVRVRERFCLHCQGYGKVLFTLSGKDILNLVLEIGNAMTVHSAVVICW